MDDYSEEGARGSGAYSALELREIEDYMEVPDELYLRWMRLHFPLTQKRKRRVKQYSEDIMVTAHSSLNYC